MLTCRVVDTKRVDAKCRASGGAEQVVADVSISLIVLRGRQLPGCFGGSQLRRLNDSYSELR
jgi:hypothetical protein